MYVRVFYSYLNQKCFLRGMNVVIKSISTYVGCKYNKKSNTLLSNSYTQFIKSLDY